MVRSGRGRTGNIKHSPGYIAMQKQSNQKWVPSSLHYCNQYSPYSLLSIGEILFLTPNKNYFSWKIEKLPPQRQNFHKIINDANFLQKLLFFLEKNPHYFSRTALSFWWFVRIYNQAMLDTGGQMREWENERYSYFRLGSSLSLGSVEAGLGSARPGPRLVKQLPLTSSAEE